MIFIDHGLDKGKSVEITKELRRLRDMEPPHDDQKRILRAAIMGYELGAVQQYAVRAASKDLPDDIKTGYAENAKLGIADLVIQLRLFCLDNYWNFNDIQAMGLDHLKERHEDFKKDGWGEK